MKKKVKSKKITKKWIIIIFGTLIIIFLIVFFLFFFHKDKQEKPIKLEFTNSVGSLKNYKNSDYMVVGWIQVQGTNIDYPVLNHNASSADPTKINFGWRSPYYISGENREVIIGHNILNISSEPSRDMSKLGNFEGLMAFIYEDFAKNNLYISYTKGDTIELYKIYAVGFFDSYSDNAESISDKDELKNYIDKVKSNSLYDYDVDVNENDKIITVKTCTRYFGLFEKQEFYIDARMVRENEPIMKYSVNKNDNYNILTKGISKENG